MGNEELLAKLRSEIQLEKEATDTEAYNEGIKEFLSTSEFEVWTFMMTFFCQMLTVSSDPRQGW